jgi:hypothetical protein
MNKTLALVAMAGLSMTAEVNGFEDNNLFRTVEYRDFAPHTFDDELRVLPIGYQPSGTSGPRFSYADDNELRVLPIGYHPSSSNRPHVMSADEELRVLPIGYHPSSPNRPHVIYTDEELRVLKVGNQSSPPKRPHTMSADEELSFLLVGYYPSSPNKPQVIYTDEELRVLSVGNHSGSPKKPHTMSVDEELSILPIDFYLSHPSRRSGGVWTDDELRTIPSLYPYIAKKYGKQEPTKEVSNNNELLLRPISLGAIKKPHESSLDDEFRLIGVGAGSLTAAGHSHKKNTTETVKPTTITPTETMKPTPIISTETVKPTPISLTKAADDELSFSRFFNRRPHHSKNTTQTAQVPQKEVTDSQGADNSLLDLAGLMREFSKFGRAQKKTN